MSMQRFRGRVSGAIALCAVAITMTALPVSADSITVWVDDDGQAGPSGCGGSTAAASTIGDGIAAASPGDKVLVCPGTYVELVEIDVPDLTVSAVQPWKAVVKAPPITTGRRPAALAPVVYVTADAATVQWLEVRLPSPPGCYLSATAIRVYDASDVQIRSNRIIGGRNSNSLHCGLLTGIDVHQSSGLVAFNTIRNFNDVAIDVAESSGEVQVVENSIHWQHTGTFCGSTACTAAARAGRSRPAGAPSTTGISISDSTAKVLRNHLEVDADSPDEAEAGMFVDDSPVRIRRNTVIRFRSGITLNGSSGTIAENQVRRGQGSGIQIVSDGDTSVAIPNPIVRVQDNRVRGFADVGIGMFGSGLHLIEGNDVTGNPGTDCYDSITPTENLWVDNLGDDQNQDGLCEPPV